MIPAFCLRLAAAETDPEADPALVATDLDLKEAYHTGYDRAVRDTVAAVNGEVSPADLLAGFTIHLLDGVDQARYDVRCGTILGAKDIATAHPNLVTCDWCRREPTEGC